MEALKHHNILSKSALVGCLGGATYNTLRFLDTWLGDWVGPIWILSTFLVPFLISVPLARIGKPILVSISGGIFGILVVAVPRAIYLVTLAVSNREVEVHITGSISLVLWSTFVVVAIGMGILAAQLGINVSNHFGARTSCR